MDKEDYEKRFKIFKRITMEKASIYDFLMNNYGDDENTTKLKAKLLKEIEELDEEKHKLYKEYKAKYLDLK